MPPSGEREFMAAWAWRGPEDDPALEDLIRRERVLLSEWALRGVLRSRAIASDECTGWLVLRCVDERSARALLDALPLRRWLEFTLTPLAQT